jgi:hypothetical protein
MGWWRVTASSILARNGKTHHRTGPRLCCPWRESLWNVGGELSCRVTASKSCTQAAQGKVAGVGAQYENCAPSEIHVSVVDERDEADNDETRVDDDGEGKTDDPESTSHHWPV